MAKNDNSRYLVFAAFYVGEAQFNATEAAKLAGFKASTRNSLNSQASEALRRPDVQEYIRNHVQKIEIKQEDLLREMYKLAMWDHEKDDPSKREVDEEEEDGATSLKDLLDAPFSMEEAKLYDTKMRAKLKSLSDLLKTFDNDTARELEKVRKAIEEHRRIHPETTDKEREQIFKDHINPKLVEQVMTELLAADANRDRLRLAEQEVADPMAGERE
jgi:hypothetical protein